MSADGTISLIGSLLPSVNCREGSKFQQDTTLNTTKLREKCELNLKLAELFLIVTQQTIQALESGCYKKFDALKMDFGCQITALEIQELVQKPELLTEALKIRGPVEDRLANIQTLFKRVPPGDSGEAIRPYLADRLGLDIPVSENLANLIRSRLLCIINTNIVVDGGEKPITNIDLLPVKATKILPKSLLKSFIHAIQVDESLRATQFIRSKAAALTVADTDRAPLLQRLLQEDKVQRAKNRIFSSPLLYNAEVSLRCLRVPLLIKNKLFLGIERIKGVDPVRIFLEMPSGKLLNNESVKQLNPRQPLVVIEGFINNESALLTAIEKVGIYGIMRVNSAQCSQYAGIKSIDVPDEEANQELKHLKSCNEIVSAINIDHIFCSSIQEEMNNE